MLSEKLSQNDNCTITLKCKYNSGIETIIIETTTTIKHKPKNIEESMKSLIDVKQKLDETFSEESFVKARDFS